MKSILCAVVALGFASSAVADTINVPAGGDIQAAINGASNGDIIQLEAGEYFPAAAINTNGKAVTLRGVAGKGKDGSPASIIDGQESGRVMVCSTMETSATVFENLQITGGRTTAAGAGMYISGANPTIRNCAFLGNVIYKPEPPFGVSGGAGMAMVYASPLLEDCLFEGNVHQMGGVDQIAISYSTPRIVGCTFVGSGDTAMVNTESSSVVIDCVFVGGYFCVGNNGDVPEFEGCTFYPGTYGSGMWNSSSSPTLVDCSFIGSVVNPGRGMYNQNSSPMLTGCLFQGNSAGYGGRGGGMYNSKSNPTLIDCTFSGNMSTIGGNWGDGGGGGMYNEESSPVLTNCIFLNNVSLTVGAGMENDWGSNPFLDGCVFEGNIAHEDGGGMRSDEGSSPTLSGCTFTENSALYGGGMSSYGGSSPSMTDCTFQQNNALAGGGLIVYPGSLATLADSLLCGNTPEQTWGDWTDDGGNTVSNTCPSNSCLGDINGDGEVNGGDLGLLIAAWGFCSEEPCVADLTGDEVISGADLGILLGVWGPCP